MCLWNDALGEGVAEGEFRGLSRGQIMLDFICHMEEFDVNLLASVCQHGCTQEPLGSFLNQNLCKQRLGISIPIAALVDFHAVTLGTSYWIKLVNRCGMG